MSMTRKHLVWCGDAPKIGCIGWVGVDSAEEAEWMLESGEAIQYFGEVEVFTEVSLCQ